MQNLENYVNSSKNHKTFEFVKDIKLKEVLYLFSAYVFYIYFEQFLKSEDENLKEMLAHTIFVYLWSIIEAVIYYFVQTELKDEKSKRKYLEIEYFKKLQKIIKTENLYICELEKKEISLNDSINFNALINWLKDKKLLDKWIIKKIDYFRKMRNLVHINAFLNNSEYNLLKELQKSFINTKDIFDYVEERFWVC